MTRNTHPEFVGYDEIVRRHGETLAMMRAAAASRQWGAIHTAHYDWWMFPVDQSSTYAYAWTVYDEDVAALRARPGFLADYRDGVRLLLLAWGWSVESGLAVAQPAPEQRWQYWPIRLEKCGRSLWLFGEFELYAAVRTYALNLRSAGVSMDYRGRDCGAFFVEHDPQQRAVSDG